jgi:ABC-type multidrug transport system ATPase subunit
VKHLSGGMKQKLTLSLALAPEPRLLILDEPTASLDAGTRERLYQLIQQRAGSATLILSSHRLEEIRHLSDEVIVMENGTITRRCHVETYVDSVQPLEESRIHAVA